MSGNDKRVEEMLEYMRDVVLHPERHPEHWEDWIREMRRNLMLLNIIYYIQQVCGSSEVTKKELEEFLEELYWIDKEIFFSIIKPWKPLDSTLEELLERRFIIKTEKGYAVNREKIKTEEDFGYWKSVRHIFDLVEIRQQKKFEVLAVIYWMQKDLEMEHSITLKDIELISKDFLDIPETSSEKKRKSHIYYRKLLLHSILEQFLELDYLSRTKFGTYIVNERKIDQNNKIKDAMNKIKKIMEAETW